MKKVFLFIYVILIVAFLKLVITFTVNEVFISRYNKKNYEENLVKSLLLFNFSESYIAHYNYGNVLYKLGDYEEAIVKYEKALSNRVPDNRVCDVRVNLALAMVSDIDDSLTMEEKRPLLKKARKVLYVDECAHEEDDAGRSKKAEEVEAEIRKLEEEKEEENKDSDDNKKDDDNNATTDENKKVEEIEERNKAAIKERSEDLDRDENLDNYNFDYYDGKKW